MEHVPTVWAAPGGPDLLCQALGPAGQVILHDQSRLSGPDGEVQGPQQVPHQKVPHVSLLGKHKFCSENLIRYRYPAR